MKKNLRYIIAFLLAIMMLLSLCACAQTGTAGNSGELDLDYVGEDTDQPEEEKPWYSWFTEAFSFGKKETTTTPSQSKPDSVADFYAQGSGDAPQGNKGNKTDQTPSTTPEEDTANKPSNSGGKKDDNKKNDQKGEDSNTPAPTPEQKPESKKNTVTITIRCDTAVNNGMHLESKWAGIVPASRRDPAGNHGGDRGGRHGFRRPRLCVRKVQDPHVLSGRYLQWLLCGWHQQPL